MINKSSNDYKILKPLGTGGTAEVFLTEHINNGKLAALKFRKEEALELRQFLSLIKREHQILSNNKYPGILRVMGIIEPDSTNPALALEYCPYPTLDEIGKIESIPALLNILSSIAINLYYLQLSGIKHGDLKPHNIFLTTELDNYSKSNSLYTKISDFSLALKTGEDYSTRLGLGTLGYCAPETIDNEILDFKSDIFSFGIIAYFLSTGINPFIGDEIDPVKINANIKELIPTPPKELNPEIPQGLSELILQMIERNPTNRPETGYLIAERLNEIGAKYKYQKAIRPKYLCFDQNDNARANSENYFFELEDDLKSELTKFSGASQKRLRHLLEINFSHNRLNWTDGKLGLDLAKDKLLYPRKLQCEAIDKFHSLAYSQKRTYILSAIAGGIDNLNQLGRHPEIPRELEKPIIHYLNKSLSNKTAQRFGNKLARISEIESNDELLTARLYIRAANTKDGYNSTLAASNASINENQNSIAIDLWKSYLDLFGKDEGKELYLKALMELGDLYKQTGDLNDAEKTYNEIVACYRDSEPDKLLGEAYKDLGDVYKAKRDHEKGIETLKKAEAIYLQIGDQLELSHTMNNLGTIYTIDSKLDKALLEFRKALRIQRKLNVAHDIASTLNNIAAVYYYKGVIPRTQKFFKEALKLQREIGNSGEIARTLNNIGIIHVEKGEYDSALESLEESFNLNSRIGSKKELLFNYENLTAAMLAAGKLKEAFKLLKQGMQLALEIDDMPHIATFYSSMGLVQKRMGYYGKALKYFNKTLKIIETIRDDYLKVYCYSELADIYLKLNNRAKALGYLDQQCKLAETIDDNRAKMIGNIIRGELDDNVSMIQSAIESAQTNDSGQALTVARLRMAGYLIRYEKLDEFKSNIDKLSKNYLSEQSDIEKAFYFNLLGRYYFIVKDYQNSVQYYNMARQHAVDSHLNPELITALSGLGKNHFQKNDFEESYRLYRKALDTLKAVTADLDEIDKGAFLKRNDVIRIMQGIKKLNEILAKNRV